MTWHYMTQHDMTWCDITWHSMSWHVVTLHDTVCNDMTWHYMTQHDISWHDTTWRDMTHQLVLQLRVMRRWDTAQVSCTQAGIWVWLQIVLLSVKCCGVLSVHLSSVRCIVISNHWKMITILSMNGFNVTFKTIFVCCFVITFWTWIWNWDAIAKMITILSMN